MAKDTAQMQCLFLIVESPHYYRIVVISVRKQFLLF